MSEATLYWRFYKIGLQMNMKEKKLHLSRKNVIDCLAFFKKYEQWTINDWSHVTFSNKTKINRFSYRRI